VGSSGLNTFRGPHYFDTDASLVKRFMVKERVSATFTSGSLGQISTDFGGARVMQLALRIDF